MAQEKKQQTMKAVVCTEYGEPNKVLKMVDLPIPEPKDNEILIEIYAAALNPVDYKMVKGWLVRCCYFYLNVT